MTLLEAMTELDRLLKYDAQVLDAGDTFDNRKPTYRQLLTQARWRCQRYCLIPPPTLKSVAVSAGEFRIDLEASGVWWILRAWWDDSELGVDRPGVDERYIDFTVTGRPAEMWTQGGLVRLHPVPQDGGTLKVYAYVLSPAFTSADDDSQIADVPPVLHQSLCMVAAALWLRPYTEQAAKAQQYELLAVSDWNTWRGEAFMARRRHRSPAFSGWGLMP